MYACIRVRVTHDGGCTGRVTVSLAVAAFMEPEVTLDYCRSIPKVVSHSALPSSCNVHCFMVISLYNQELHAHLNGSVSDRTMQALLHKSGFNKQDDQHFMNTVIEKGEQRTLDEYD